MKQFRIVLVNLKRRKMRTILTVGSFAVALFLYGLLVTIDAAFYQGIEIAGQNRLLIINHISLIMPLPLSYKEQLKQMDGIKHVSFSSWFGGVYQEERNFFPQFAIETETWRQMYPEFIVPDDQWKAFEADREGAIVGKTIADRFGFKVGDRIPLKGTIFRGVWEFNIRGIYEGKRKADDTSQFWFHNAYLEERREWGKGLVGWYIVEVSNPDDAARMAKAIDERYANSPYETTTETERAFAAGFVKQFGNIRFIIMAVGGVVCFTLLLITGSNMAISVRERTGEIAVLKTIGFSDLRVLVLVLLESLAYALTGGLIGLGLCKLFTLGGDPTGGMLAMFYLSPRNIVIGAAAAVLVGVVSGLIPAVLAMRLKIVDAMRRV